MSGTTNTLQRVYRLLRTSPKWVTDHDSAGHGFEINRNSWPPIFLAFPLLALMLMSTVCHAGGRVASQSQNSQYQEIASANQKQSANMNSGAATLSIQAPAVGSIGEGFKFSMPGRKEDGAKNRSNRKSACRTGGTYKVGPSDKPQEGLRSDRCQEE